MAKRSLHVQITGTMRPRASKLRRARTRLALLLAPWLKQPAPQPQVFATSNLINVKVNGQPLYPPSTTVQPWPRPQNIC